MTRRTRAFFGLAAARAAELAADLATVGLAYLLAFAVRFDFAEPSWGWHATALSFAPVAVVHLAALALCGCYRTGWRRMRLAELPRYLAATALAGAALTLLRAVLPGVGYAALRPPYSITLLTFFFATVGLVSLRGLLRLAWLARARDTALLERDARHFDNAVAARYLAGKRVLVTGAGGSIGSEIVRQVFAAGAARIVLVENGEHALYDIDREMRARGAGERLKSVLADCGDRSAMDALLAAERPDVILHAAAYKHVPLVEANPEAGLRNNVEGTRVIAECARAHGVSRFVLISTDKAVNPVSAMGRSKKAAEDIVLALNPADPASDPHAPSFCAVRFGNVLGSSGSVVPLFREQIAQGGPVTVTHPDMRRYFMTVEEAVSLVLQAASRAEAAVYTLDMGESVSILDLAEQMIAQAGYRPYADIPIVFTGIRPGERLFEELDISDKSAYVTDMAKIYVTRA